MEMPPHRMLNRVYAWCVRNLDPEKREEWDAMLMTPIAGIEPTPREIEAEAQGFMDLMGAGLPGVRTG